MFITSIEGFRVMRIIFLRCKQLQKFNDNWSSWIDHHFSAVFSYVSNCLKSRSFPRNRTQHTTFFQTLSIYRAWWSNLTPFKANHARYFISSSYMLRMLEAKLIKTIVGTWNNVIYNSWQNHTILNDTDAERSPVVLFEVIISILEERICALS